MGEDPSGFLILFLFSSFPAFAGDVLTEVLREKGGINKEDWIRIEADREKKAAGSPEKKKSKDGLAIPFWSKKGFGFATEDGNWRTSLQWRFQGRYTFPERSDPRKVKDFSDNAESSFELRRVRMKIGGNGYKPWIKYYFEVDLQPGRTFGDSSSKASTRLIDWRIMIGKYKWLQLRLGQWKVNYNRERVDSSGKQQFVERSIVNRVFTIDRQIGAMVYGHLFPGTGADSRYFVGVFTGSGRGLEKNDDSNMMYMGRFQWNFLGRDLKFKQSDTKYHEHPTASIAVGGYTTIGRCTRWSSSGCGSLGSAPNGSATGFTSAKNAVNGQFRVEGMVEEFAFKWRGLSFQHEYHWKKVKDAGRAGKAGTTAAMLPVTSFVAMINPVAPSTTVLMGSYAQVGYFFHYLVPVIPKPLETAFRYAFVDPDVGATGDFRQEFTGALNWFFAGHRNKLTIDASHLTLDQVASARLTEQRVRLQWDVSF